MTKETRQKLFDYFAQEHDIMLMDGDYNELDALIASEIARHDAELMKMVNSISVRVLLRFGVKNPTESGMDNYIDKSYIDLYDYLRDIPLPETYKPEP